MFHVSLGNMFLIITSIVHLGIYILLHDICFHPKLQASWKMAKVLAFVLISFFFTDGIPAKLGVGIYTAFIKIPHCLAFLDQVSLSPSYKDVFSNNFSFSHIF